MSISDMLLNSMGIVKVDRAEVSSMVSRTPLSMSTICRRSGVPIEPPIWEPAVDRVTRSEQIYSVAVGKGKKVRG